MKRARSLPASSFASGATAVRAALAALSLFAALGCASSPRDASDALKPCADPGGFCRVRFAGGDESACYRMKHGELVCETVAQAP